MNTTREEQEAISIELAIELIELISSKKGHTAYSIGVALATVTDVLGRISTKPGGPDSINAFFDGIVNAANKSRKSAFEELAANGATITPDPDLRPISVSKWGSGKRQGTS